MGNGAEQQLMKKAMGNRLWAMGEAREMTGDG